MCAVLPTSGTRQLAWEVPVVERRIAAYCLTAKEHDDYPDDDLPPASFEMAEREFTFNMFHGEPIDPNECFEFNVKLRYHDDAGACACACVRCRVVETSQSGVSVGYASVRWFLAGCCRWNCNSRLLLLLVSPARDPVVACHVRVVQ